MNTERVQGLNVANKLIRLFLYYTLRAVGVVCIFAAVAAVAIGGFFTILIFLAGIVRGTDPFSEHLILTVFPVMALVGFAVFEAVKRIPIFLECSFTRLHPGNSYCKSTNCLRCRTCKIYREKL